MATYYIDFTNGNDSADGLTPTGDATNGPWATLNKFTFGARSAGDIAIVRRGMSDTSATNINFTTDGDIDNPIIVKADYGDTWSDFATCSETGTFTVGSKTVTFTADVSGEISANDWIYISGEDNETYSYEVETVSTSTVTLYMPYKGQSAGSGKTVIIMPSVPEWQTVSQSSYYVTFLTDDNWVINGLWAKSSNSSGVYQINDVSGIKLVNCIAEGNGSGDIGFRVANLGDDKALFELNKFRVKNCQSGALAMAANYTSTSKESFIKGMYVESNGSGVGLYPLPSGMVLEDIELYNLATGVEIRDLSTSSFIRNISFDTVTNEFYIDSQTQKIYIEDYAGTTGDNRVFGYSGTATSPTELIKKDTGVTRVGGADSSILVTPTDYIGDGQPLKLLDIPIYLTAAQKTVTIYFKSHTTTEWTASPTASELYIEIDYLGASSGAGRSVKNSTGTVDFTTDTDYDQSLAVTFTPGQAGLAYIKLWYKKKKESGKTNKFYVDPKPVIS